MAETVEAVASRLSGATEPDGEDGVDLMSRNWLLHFGKESEALCKEMSARSEWLASTGRPPWAAYCALMAS
eukprot:scaffold180215_cov36-Attheya_sp.AAC.1